MARTPNSDPPSRTTRPASNGEQDDDARRRARRRTSRHLELLQLEAKRLAKRAASGATDTTTASATRPARSRWHQFTLWG